MERIPTPWTHDGNGYVFATSQDGLDCLLICTATSDESDALTEFDVANMDFISTAVNNHEALLASLREMTSLAQEAVECRIASEDPADHEMLPQYEADLARAEELIQQLSENRL